MRPESDAPSTGSRPPARHRFVTCCGCTAMLLDGQAEPRVSTGLDALDEVLGGLYWGDNVVWQLDRAPVEPFYRAIASRAGRSRPRPSSRWETRSTRTASPGWRSSMPAARGPPTCSARSTACATRGRRLLLFESLDSMVSAWGAAGTREFFARCCPLLLEVGAIAYWTMSARDTPAAVQETVHAVDAVRAARRRAQRPRGQGGGPRRRRPGLGAALARAGGAAGPRAAGGRRPRGGSLRAVRRARKLSQHDLGDLAGVTASAISQAERAERGLSLATLVRLSAALGVTIDDLLRGDDSRVYRIGRRTDDPAARLERTLTLLGGADSDLLDRSRAPRRARDRRGAGDATGHGDRRRRQRAGPGQGRGPDAGDPPRRGAGRRQRADRGWRNLGQAEAMLFWIVFAESRR